jgi:chromosome segregation ATPase
LIQVNYHGKFYAASEMMAADGTILYQILDHPGYPGGLFVLARDVVPETSNSLADLFSRLVELERMFYEEKQRMATVLEKMTGLFDRVFAEKAQFQDALNAIKALYAQAQTNIEAQTLTITNQETAINQQTLAINSANETIAALQLAISQGNTDSASLAAQLAELQQQYGVVTNANATLTTANAALQAETNVLLSAQQALDAAIDALGVEVDNMYVPE